jgi:hypothetical protein
MEPKRYENVLAAAEMEFSRRHFESPFSSKIASKILEFDRKLNRQKKTSINGL